MKVLPYLSFGGRCDEALKFYGEALGAKVLFAMRFKDAPPDPERPLDPALADKVMHVSFQIGESVLMGSDGDDKVVHGGYSLSMNPPSVEEGQKMFDALVADGGSVTMPFGKTFWALGFGMLRDKFGVPWMISVESPNPQP